MKKENTRIEEVEEINDEENPEFLFCLTWNSLLIKIAKGEIDPVQIAKQTLKNRGLTAENDYQYKTTFRPRHR